MSFQPTVDSRADRGRPTLRLLRGGQPEPARATGEGTARILVAGADAERRANVLRNLSEALPDETQFGEAGAAWEVLEQAPSSGVVMLAGDLDEATAESLMHVLGHRYPSLPVVALGLAADGGGARQSALAGAGRR
ncbi:MAG TPA: hypothetical protein VMS02_01680 [Solirubrobacteraceae bacterium]|nr:hypothetical protein [Solirubrobacteraceae bacterium]